MSADLSGPAELPLPVLRRAAALIAGPAAVSTDPAGHMRDLILRAGFPAEWRHEVVGGSFADLGVSARRLLLWAQSKGRNTGDPRYTAVGSLLAALLDDVGPDVGAEIAAILLVHGLVVTPAAVAEIEARFSVPREGTDMAVWPGPQPWIGDDADLQARRPRPLPMLDVAYLAGGIRQATTVCRVDDATGSAVGTGLLVAPDLVLTCFHVVDGMPPGAIRLWFQGAGDAAEVEARTVAGDPVVAHSVTAELDFALLRLDAALGDRGVVRWRPEGVAAQDDLALLQHPDGGAMRLAVSANAVLRVHPARNAISYAAPTAGGSSGGPCYDDDWRVIAMHRAERATVFGTVREGVLIGAVLDRIRGHL